MMRNGPETSFLHKNGIQLKNANNIPQIYLVHIKLKAFQVHFEEVSRV
jgi:hypothetical protein